MKWITPGLAAALCVPLHAMIVVDTVQVAGGTDNAGGVGAVPSDYYIGTYEVTNSQYVAFLNSVDPLGANTRKIYNSNMTSSALGGIEYQPGAPSGTKYGVKPGMGNKPVNYVTFWDAARFANWLTTGGDTETGMYTTFGDTNPTGVNRDASAWLAGGVAVASRDEWFRAAYHQPASQGGDADNFWQYPTATNSTPSNDVVDPDPGNNANFFQGGYTLGAPTYLTDAGAFENSASFYGTFDQGGNVAEWTETIVAGESRFVLGSLFSGDSDFMQASSFDFVDSALEGSGIGFRVVSLEPIPEPAAGAAIAGALALACVAARRTKLRCVLM